MRNRLVRRPDEAAHYCPNIYGCPPQIKGRIEHFVSRRAMDINIAEATVDQLFRQGLISDISDLYRLTYEQLVGLERFADKSASNILKSIEESKSRPLPRLVYALGIRYVGETVARKLAMHFRSVDNLMNASYDDLTGVEEVGDRIAQSIREYFEHPVNRKILGGLREAGMTMQMQEEEQPASSKLGGKTFVISGTFEGVSRNELKDIIEKNGGTNTSSVSSNTDFIIAGEDMGPAKKEKARQLNIPLIGIGDFLRMIK